MVKLIPKNKKGNWIQKAVNPKHVGFCSPITKKTCTKKRKAFAMTMKKHHGFHKKENGGEISMIKTNEKGGEIKKPIPLKITKRVGGKGPHKVIVEKQGGLILLGQNGLVTGTPSFIKEAVAKYNLPEAKEQRDFEQANERAAQISGRTDLSPIQPEDFIGLGMLAGSKLLPKLLPKAFVASADKFYRTIGEKGFEDLQKTGMLRANPLGAGEGKGILAGRPSDVPYFAKGKIGKYPGDKYVAEVSKQLYQRGEMNPVTSNLLKGRHGGYKMLDEAGNPSNIPIEDVTILKKNWWSGYKPISIK